MALDAYINGKTEKRPKEVEETLRFELGLRVPTEEDTNEFSYLLLVEDALRKKQNLHTPSVPSDAQPGGRLEAIARDLEEKYGSKRTKRRLQETDLIDRGCGYDVGDSFVDDTELYEDFVPPDLDTQYGGFYINSGDLEFKSAPVKELDDSDFAAKPKKKPKLVKISSHSTPQAILASQKLKKAKQHVAAQKTPCKSKTLKRTLFLTTTTSDTSAPLADPTRMEVEGAKVTYGASSVPIGGVGVIKEPNPTTSLSSNGHANGSISGGGADQGDPAALLEGGVKKDAKPPPTLPENLPLELSLRVQQLELALGKAQSAGGKIPNKASLAYNEQLVTIELACKSVNLKTRSAVLEYVSSKMCISRATLSKRVKQELRKREAESLEEPLRQLKEVIDASMPAIAAQFEEELRVWTETTSMLGDREIKMEVDDESRLDDIFEDSTTLGGASHPDSTAGSSKPKRPRKVYKWTENSRRLVCEVVRVKVESEENVNRISRGNAEEIVLEFLDNKVRPLWPKGWMQKRTLYRIAEPIHRHFTDPEAKKAVKSKEKGPAVARKPSLSTPVVATQKPLGVVSPSGVSPALKSAIASATQVVLAKQSGQQTKVKPLSVPRPAQNATVPVIRTTLATTSLMSKNVANVVVPASTGSKTSSMVSPRLSSMLTSVDGNQPVASTSPKLSKAGGTGMGSGAVASTSQKVTVNKPQISVKLQVATPVATSKKTSGMVKTTVPATVSPSSSVIPVASPVTSTVLSGSNFSLLLPQSIFDLAAAQNKSLSTSLPAGLIHTQPSVITPSQRASQGVPQTQTFLTLVPAAAAAPKSSSSFPASPVSFSSQVVKTSQPMSTALTAIVTSSDVTKRIKPAPVVTAGLAPRAKPSSLTEHRPILKKTVPSSLTPASSRSSPAIPTPSSSSSSTATNSGMHPTTAVVTKHSPKHLLQDKHPTAKQQSTATVSLSPSTSSPSRHAALSTAVQQQTSPSKPSPPKQVSVRPSATVHSPLQSPVQHSPSKVVRFNVPKPALVSFSPSVIQTASPQPHLPTSSVLGQKLVQASSPSPILLSHAQTPASLMPRDGQAHIPQCAPLASSAGPNTARLASGTVTRPLGSPNPGRLVSDLATRPLGGPNHSGHISGPVTHQLGSPNPSRLVSDPATRPLGGTNPGRHVSGPATRPSTGPNPSGLVSGMSTRLPTGPNPGGLVSGPSTRLLGGPNPDGLVSGPATRPPTGPNPGRLISDLSTRPPNPGGLVSGPATHPPTGSNPGRLVSDPSTRPLGGTNPGGLISGPATHPPTGPNPGGLVSGSATRPLGPAVPPHTSFSLLAGDTLAPHTNPTLPMRQIISEHSYGNTAPANTAPANTTANTATAPTNTATANAATANTATANTAPANTATANTAPAITATANTAPAAPIADIEDSLCYSHPLLYIAAQQESQHSQPPPSTQSNQK